MTDFIETHRSFVNTWETDENDHMNVQFYYKRFDEAARFFDMLSAGARPDGALPRDRHVRYHVELLAASTTRIRSAVLADGDLAGRVVHLLEHSGTGALCATALDWPSGLDHACTIGEAEIERALPKTIAANPFRPVEPEAILAVGGLVANRSIVGAGECATDATMREQFYIGRFSDSAPHAWSCLDVDVEWLRARNLGRVAVEMKITHHEPARAGDALAVYSVPSTSWGKTVTLHHEIVRATDGAPVASGEVVALILDLEARKATRLPDAVAERMDRLSQGIGLKQENGSWWRSGEGRS